MPATATNGALTVLRRRIATVGPLTMADYMAEALLNPAFGYYRRGQPIGAGGDFVTAPELSQMFGELVGLWCAQVWLDQGRPDPVLLVELGPGRGTLMADLLRATRPVPGFHAAIRLHLVDSNPDLRAEQAMRLAGTGAVWHESLSSVPDGPALVVANEFFDALPVRQFVRHGTDWAERLVDADPDGPGLRWVLAPCRGLATVLGLPAATTLPEGHVVELCSAGQALMVALADRACRHGGAILVIDYGDAAPSGQPTVQAVRGHAAADPLGQPGGADLTAHVDFGRLAACARSQGAAVHGPVGQGVFLQTLGIAARAERLRLTATPTQAAQLDNALHRLIAPDAMGTLVKALAVTGTTAPPPPGFPAPPGPLQG